MNNRNTRTNRCAISEQTRHGRRIAKTTLPVNRIIHGHALDVLRSLPSETIDMCVTSPPYWGLRVYGTNPQIWGGNPNCEHQWGEALEFHSIRETTTHGNTRITERSCGQPPK